MMFVQGHDTFVMIPNGYGKSIIYGFLLLVFDKFKGMKTLLSFYDAWYHETSWYSYML